MIRFLHPSDWQLGMRQHLLSEGAQDMYSQPHFDVIRAMGASLKKRDAGSCLCVTTRSSRPGGPKDRRPS